MKRCHSYRMGGHGAQIRAQGQVMGRQTGGSGLPALFSLLATALKIQYPRGCEGSSPSFGTTTKTRGYVVLT